jgi:hypothetical protein
MNFTGSVWARLALRTWQFWSNCLKVLKASMAAKKKKDSDLMWDCTRCGKKAYAAVMTADFRLHCLDCSLEVKSASVFIRSMKDIPEVEAPLGYHFVGRHYFFDELDGRIEADYLFDKDSLKYW